MHAEGQGLSRRCVSLGVRSPGRRALLRPASDSKFERARGARGRFSIARCALALRPPPPIAPACCTSARVRFRQPERLGARCLNSQGLLGPSAVDSLATPERVRSSETLRLDTSARSLCVRVHLPRAPRCGSTARSPRSFAAPPHQHRKFATLERCIARGSASTARRHLCYDRRRAQFACHPLATASAMGGAPVVSGRQLANGAEFELLRGGRRCHFAEFRDRVRPWFRAAFARAPSRCGQYSGRRPTARGHVVTGPPLMTKGFQRVRGSDSERIQTYLQASELSSGAKGCGPREGRPSVGIPRVRPRC